MKLQLSLLFMLLSITIQAKTLEIYFDTPELTLLKNQSSVKYQAVSYINKKNKIKYKEHIIYTYDKNKTKVFTVKHYHSVKFVEEKHPLLALVKRKDRTLFIGTLKTAGIKYPLKLKQILESTDSNKSYLQLFSSHTKDDSFFTMKFQYPYIMNLVYAIITSLIGALVIYIFFRRRL